MDDAASRAMRIVRQALPLNAALRPLASSVVLLAALAVCSCGPRKEAPPLVALAGTEKSVPGDPSELFDDSILHRVELRFEEGAWERVLSDWLPDSVKAPQYRVAASVTIDGKTIANVGVRSRGNMLNTAYRRPLKLKFNATEPLYGKNAPGLSPRADFRAYGKRSFMGLDSLNLRASGNDPTLIRELLAYKLFRDAGVPAPRAALAQVFINGESQGVYTIAEEIGKRFLRSWFAEADGGLWKAGWEDNQGAGFRPGSFGEARYSKESGKDGKRELVDFMEALGRVRDGKGLEALMDKRNLLSYMAVCSLTGHWDSLMGNTNNDHVYRDPSTGAWSIVVWDADNSFGSDWIQDIDTVNAPIDALAPFTNREALFITLAREHWAGEYRSLLKEMLNGLGQAKALTAEVRRLRDLIRETVRTEDPWLLDYQLFMTAFDQKPASSPFKGLYIEQYRADTGLSNFISRRLEVLRDGLEWQ